MHYVVNKVIKKLARESALSLANFFLSILLNYEIFIYFCDNLALFRLENGYSNYDANIEVIILPQSLFVIPNLA